MEHAGRVMRMPQRFSSEEAIRSRRKEIKVWTIEKRRALHRQTAA
ncbi:hypothetical protein [Limimaricola sp. G21655-S1]|nr:hypothetical protein [Limimaricola sp. G21655-S1]